MNVVTVACVLKSGGVFTAEWVERLRDQCAEHLPPHHFVCLSDVPVPVERIPLTQDWPGWWSKLEMYRPDVLNGRVVYFDLDTLIVGDASRLFGYTGPFAALTDFYTPKMAASGVMAWDGAHTGTLWKNVLRDLPEFRGRSDFFLNRLVKPERLQELYPGLIGSYKAHNLETGPKNYSVICFHGTPKQPDFNRGHWVNETWGAA